MIISSYLISSHPISYIYILYAISKRVEGVEFTSIPPPHPYKSQTQAGQPAPEPPPHFNSPSTINSADQTPRSNTPLKHPGGRIHPRCGRRAGAVRVTLRYLTLHSFNPPHIDIPLEMGNGKKMKKAARRNCFCFCFSLLRRSPIGDLLPSFSPFSPYFFSFLLLLFPSLRSVSCSPCRAVPSRSSHSFLPSPPVPPATLALLAQ